jgi:hypothetical protein
MIVLPCRDLFDVSCRLVSSLSLSSPTLRYVALISLFVSGVCLSCLDVTCLIVSSHSILALSTPTIGLLALSCRFMSFLDLPCPSPIPNLTPNREPNSNPYHNLTLTNPISLGRKPCWEVLIYVLKTKILCFDITLE